MDLTRSSATVAAARTLDETDAVRVVRAVAMLFCGELEAGRKDTSGPAGTQADYRRLAHDRVSWRCVNREAVQRVHLQRLCEVGVFLMYDTSDANRLIAGLLRRDASLEDVMRVVNCFRWRLLLTRTALRTDSFFCSLTMPPGPTPEQIARMQRRVAYADAVASFLLAGVYNDLEQTYNGKPGVPWG